MAPAVCVELKPKWGALPAAPAVHPDHGMKLHASKFQLQQALKLAQARLPRRGNAHFLLSPACPSWLHAAPLITFASF